MSVANTVERQMLDLINQERAEAGLNPVKLNMLLNDSSEDHSQWMIESDQFSHTGEGGSSPHARMEAANYPFEGSWTSGENIAWQSERGAEGIADDVVQLHEGLMASPGHRANILNPDFTEIGIGIERGDFDGSDGVVVTQNFARTDGDTSQSVEPDNGSNPDPAPEPETPVAETPEEPETPVEETPEEPETPVAEAPETPEPTPPVAEEPEAPEPTPVDLPSDDAWCEIFMDDDQDEDIFDFMPGDDDAPQEGDANDDASQNGGSLDDLWAQLAELFNFDFRHMEEPAPEEATDTMAEDPGTDELAATNCWDMDFA